MPEHGLLDFQRALQAAGFRGEIDASLAARTVMATDNSVYELMPQAVLYPRDIEDIVCVLQLAARQFPALTFTPRGGGTSTNGQCLGEGITIDCSRHMRGITHLDLSQRTVTVEAGVVLDELNRFLQPFGCFFPVAISTGSRATLGGMFNTNACGKGSSYYGRMSDNVSTVTAVMADGTVMEVVPLSPAELITQCQRTDSLGAVYRQVSQTVSEHATAISNLYPQLARTLTGYTLAEVWRDEQFHLSAVLAGAEGTLAVVTNLTLKLRPLPRQRLLAAIQYMDFMQALEDGPILAALSPVAIEVVDARILALAERDSLFTELREDITHPEQQVGGLTLAEWVVDEDSALVALMQRLQTDFAAQSPVTRLQVRWITEPKRRQQLWELRKKCVGLLGNFEWQGRRPVSGIEDTLVPVTQLKPFIEALVQRLESRGLTYGMYGHLDAGCVHVRPAFNLQDHAEASDYFALVHDVVALVRRYHGILWGEHGKGFRSEFVPAVFGETLYAELCKIKAAFDPHNRLNPGKIAVAPAVPPQQLIEVAHYPLQGELNRSIGLAAAHRYQAALACNGNGACFNQARDEVMCPSYKVTAERIHSPKGRARLARQWLRIKAATHGKVSQRTLWRWVRKWWTRDDFSHAVYHAMAGCLGCRGCQTQCPSHVNVPHFKAQFLASYHSQYARSLPGFVLARSEEWAYRQARSAAWSNRLLHNPLARALIKTIGMVNLPRLSEPSLLQRGVTTFSVEQVLQQAQPGDLVLLQDFVTSNYDAAVVTDVLYLLQRLGKRVWLLKKFMNGKAWHAQGELETFHGLVKRNAARLQSLANQGLQLLGIDPSITLTYRHEYREAFTQLAMPTVHLLQEWLTPALFQQSKFAPFAEPIILLQHCTEQATCPQSATAWQAIFAAAGFTLSVADVGCCGMAGSYGMQRQHQVNARQLFMMSWEPWMHSSGVILATGFSCRSQIGLCSQRRALHPLSFLAQRVIPS